MPVKKQKTFRATFRIETVVTADITADTLDSAMERAKTLTDSGSDLIVIGDDADAFDGYKAKLIGVSDDDAWEIE